MDSKGKEGDKADLSEANLQKVRRLELNLQEANLTRANLQEASLSGANLQQSALYEANLQKANLSLANLQEAGFNSTILREANFQDADLTDATGLLAKQFAGANVSGAKLPEEIAKFDGLAHVEELSKNSKKLFISMLLGCVYAWLTIATTTDLRLLTNSTSSPLPIIGTEIPIVGFYFAAPLLLLSIYVWLHLYLQNLWKGLSELPAIFPDGKTLDEKAYPWLLNGFVQSHVKLLKDRRPPLSQIQVGLSIFLTWWLVPLTMLILWGRFLTRHDWPITALHIVVFGLSAWVGITFFELAKATLRGDDFSAFAWQPFLRQVFGYQHKAVQIVMGIIFVLSMGAIYIPFSWTPAVYRYLPFYPFAELVEEEVSTKPTTWTGQEDAREKEIPLVKGAKLQGANLRHANLEKGFLIKADLRRANLQEASLSHANLQEARLFHANLQKADLHETNLQEADLQEADLQNAKCLSPSQIRGARNWVLAIYGDTLRAELLLPSDHNVRMKKEDLSGYDLVGYNLQNAYLDDWNLQGANLKHAQLQGAHLEASRGLTQAQLDEACVDEHTTLPEGLTRPAPCAEEE